MHRRLGTIALLVALTLAACQRTSPRGKVIVLGLDGMDPVTLDQLMAEGKMPSFARLREEGAYGRLQSTKPLLSPILWTTIATGKRPDQHGIGHFVAVNPRTGEQLPVTSHMRKVRALWNIASRAKRSVGIVGWWATWPAESVLGTVVSDHTCYHFLFPEGATGSKDASGLIYPAASTSMIQRLVRRPGDLGLGEVQRFANVSAEDIARPFDFNDDLSHFKWALATANTYRDIGLALWKRERPDLLMTYIEATDTTAHLFGHLYRATDLAGELRQQQERFGGTVEAMYRFADEIVGKFLAVMDDRTTLIVLSDHGFRLGVLPDDPSRLRDMRRVSERFHRMQGILYMYGRGVRPRTRIDGAGILDITPTVLTLLGISPARDMPGHVLDAALTQKAPARSVDSYESDSNTVASLAQDRRSDPAILEHLRSLGYLQTESPKGDRNLAAILFQEAKYQEAATAYERLLRTRPDDAALHASLAGAYGALGRYQKALAQLDSAQKLEPLNPEIYHNRGAVLERLGKTRAAVEQYRTALRYRPNYAPSRTALRRLAGTKSPQGLGRPRTEAQQRAYALAQQAARAARHGNYKRAQQALDRAETLAPRYALVQQYRANVAFLRNDQDAAIAALRKALQLEPDNALFKTNLARLQARRNAAATHGSTQAGTPSPP